MTNKEIVGIISEKIELDERLKQRIKTKSQKSFQITDFEYKKAGNSKIEINYTYTIFTETTLTVFPDNPSQANYYMNEIIINSKNKIVSDKEREIDRKTMNENWLRAQREITIALENVLLQIEWYYGENRAPVKYPPQFLHSEKGSIELFTCLLESDEGSNCEKFVFDSIRPDALSMKVRTFLNQEFGVAEARGE